MMYDIALSGFKNNMLVGRGLRCSVSKTEGTLFIAEFLRIIIDSYSKEFTPYVEEISGFYNYNYKVVLPKGTIVYIHIDKYNS